MPSTRSRPVIAVSSAESCLRLLHQRDAVPHPPSSLRGARGRGTQRSIPLWMPGSSNVTPRSCVAVLLFPARSQSSAAPSTCSQILARLAEDSRPECRRSLAGIEQRLLVNVLGCSTVEQDLDRGGARRGEMRRRGGDLVQCRDRVDPLSRSHTLPRQAERSAEVATLRSPYHLVVARSVIALVAQLGGGSDRQLGGELAGQHRKYRIEISCGLVEFTFK